MSLNNTTTLMRRIAIYDSETTRERWPENLADHIAWLQSKLDEIPACCRETAQIYYAGCDHCAVCEITFARPFTDEEIRAQEEALKDAEKNQRARELELLNQLKAKYGDTVL